MGVKRSHLSLNFTSLYECIPWKRCKYSKRHLTGDALAKIVRFHIFPVSQPFAYHFCRAKEFLDWCFEKLAKELCWNHCCLMARAFALWAACDSETGAKGRNRQNAHTLEELSNQSWISFSKAAAYTSPPFLTNISWWDKQNFGSWDAWQANNLGSILQVELFVLRTGSLQPFVARHSWCCCKVSHQSTWWTCWSSCNKALSVRTSYWPLLEVDSIHVFSSSLLDLIWNRMISYDFLWFFMIFCHPLHGAVSRFNMRSTRQATKRRCPEAAPLLNRPRFCGRHRVTPRPTRWPYACAPKKKRYHERSICLRSI